MIDFASYEDECNDTCMVTVLKNQGHWLTAVSTNLFKVGRGGHLDLPLSNCPSKNFVTEVEKCRHLSYGHTSSYLCT